VYNLYQIDLYGDELDMKNNLNGVDDGLNGVDDDSICLRVFFNSTSACFLF